VPARVSAPVTKYNRRQYLAALLFANVARKKLGRKPVKRLRKGDQVSGHSCPIAKTIGGNIFVTDLPDRGAEVTYRFENEMIAATDSKLVRDFISNFDAGEVPELIA
jgi:hypothetical protein